MVSKVVAALRALPELTAIDARDGAGTQQVTLVVDRDQAKRLGIDMEMVTTVLNNAYSQRQISTIYDSLNQYQVVLEISKVRLGPEHPGTGPGDHRRRCACAVVEFRPLREQSGQ